MRKQLQEDEEFAQGLGLFTDAAWAGLSTGAAPAGGSGIWVEQEGSVAKWGRFWRGVV